MLWLSWRRRSGRLLLLVLAAAAFALLPGSSMADHTAVPPISGNFESNDGNTPVDDAGFDDWDSVTADTVIKPDTPSGGGDESFGQGTKEDTAVPTVVDGSIPPNKSDLTEFRVYQNEGTDGHDYLYLLWQRSNTLGSANMDFEFNQSTEPSANGVTPERTAGDILITFDFASGGNVVQLGLLRWLTSGPNSNCEANGATTAEGCWGNRVDLDLSGNADGAVSADQRLGEAAIDLTDTVFGTSCLGFGGAYLKSRSSDSFTAALKDFIPPAAVNVANCGRIVIEKVTDPDPDPTDTTFNFTLTGGPSQLNESFGLKNGESFDTGADVVAGSGYVAAETVPSGWTLESATCDDDDSTPANISVDVGETVTCTFTNRTRGSVVIHKQDDAGNALAGAVFTLFVDNAPLDGPAPHGAEDTATLFTCTTDLSGNCTISDVPPGQYWVVETMGVPNHQTAPDQNIVVGAGQTVGPLTFVDPRLHVVIVLVCHEGTNTLAPSLVTNGASSATSLGSPPAGISEAQLCALGGARFDDKPHGEKDLIVDVGSAAHP
jgi:Prealbumin-like fold domain